MNCHYTTKSPQETTAGNVSEVILSPIEICSKRVRLPCYCASGILEKRTFMSHCQVFSTCYGIITPWFAIVLASLTLDQHLYIANFIFNCCLHMICYQFHRQPSCTKYHNCTIAGVGEICASRCNATLASWSSFARRAAMNVLLNRTNSPAKRLSRDKSVPQRRHSSLHGCTLRQVGQRYSTALISSVTIRQHPPGNRAGLPIHPY